MPYDIEQFNAFVWNLSTRYAGRISAYEIWNEPQLNDFLYPYDTTEVNALAEMTRRAYSTMKTCDPNALLLAASVLPRASSGGMDKADKYLSALQTKGWNVDGFTTHIYPNIDEGSDVWNSMLMDARNSIAAYGPPSSLLWVTETNYNLLGPVVSEESAPGLINATYAYAAGQEVGVIHWYGWDTTANLGGLNINHDTSAWNAIQAYLE